MSKGKILQIREVGQGTEDVVFGEGVLVICPSAKIFNLLELIMLMDGTREFIGR
jgi:hypothetical protein